MAALFELDDASADFPIAGGHQRVDAACGCMAGGFKQGDDVAVDAGVVRTLAGAGWDEAGHELSKGRFAVG